MKKGEIDKSKTKQVDDSPKAIIELSPIFNLLGENEKKSAIQYIAKLLLK